MDRLEEAGLEAATRAVTACFEDGSESVMDARVAEAAVSAYLAAAREQPTASGDASGACGPSPDAVMGPSCGVCGATMSLPVTERDSGGKPLTVSIVGVEGWSFTTDDGWTCPAHSESAAPKRASSSPIDQALRQGVERAMAERIGFLGMHAREETREAFARANARGDRGYAMAIAAYVDAGWERYWPFERMPGWLKPKWWKEPSDRSMADEEHLARWEYDGGEDDDA